jgi:hypothetical protein
MCQINLLPYFLGRINVLGIKIGIRKVLKCQERAMEPVVINKGHFQCDEEKKDQKQMRKKLKQYNRMEMT